MPSLLDDIIARLGALPDDERRQVEEAATRATRGMLWLPNPGPQQIARESEADELFLGGSAGGGKSSFAVGVALSDHDRSIIFRREYPQIKALEDEAAGILGNRDGYNAQTRVWRIPGTSKILEFGSCPHETDKTKYQGRPHDYIAFDELPLFTRSQYRFLIGWNRSTKRGQRCRVVGTGNPPMAAEQLWVIDYWAPWLDKRHPDPAEPGELRWPVRRSDESGEGDEIFFRDREEAIAHLETLGNPPRDTKGNILPPRSRTFIPARLEDNPDLMRTGYAAVLDAMPKELREALRDGKFDSGLKDAPHQLIPTAWILAAQERWSPDGARDQPMTAMAFDPAGGGRDDAVLAWRHGGWFAPLIAEKGDQTADGSWSAALIVRHRRNNVPVVVDAGGGAGHGFGGTTIMRLKDNSVFVRPYNGAGESTGRTKDGVLKFANKRAEAWWKFREALDPDQVGGSPIELPPDPELRADLASPTFEMTARGILVEDKKEIKKRIGRSPGRGDAVVMSLSEGDVAIRKSLQRAQHQGTGFDEMGRSKSGRQSEANTGHSSSNSVRSRFKRR